MKLIVDPDHLALLLLFEPFQVLLQFRVTHVVEQGRARISFKINSVDKKDIYFIAKILFVLVRRPDLVDSQRIVSCHYKLLDQRSEFNDIGLSKKL